MHYRQTGGVTLADARDRLAQDAGETLQVASSEIAVSLGGEETDSIRVGTREVPATDRSLLALSGWLDVPDPFMKRVLKDVGRDFAQDLLSTLLTRTSGSAAAVTLTDEGISEVRDPGQQPISPVRILSVAERVLGTAEATIQRLVDQPNEFSFDVHVPFDYDEGVGGDPSETVELPEDLLTRPWVPRGRQVGDVTAGGLRFGYDRKRNLAPWVQPWMFRLICTNGMETTDEGLRVDARGASADDVIANLQAVAQTAFGRIENQIRHFYDLRSTPVENPERRLRQIARERSIPDRTLIALMDEVRGEGFPDSPTEFDIVNLVTNFANSPNMRREGGRLLLERAGGAEIADHIIRCGHCHARQV